MQLLRLKNLTIILLCLIVSACQNISTATSTAPSTVSKNLNQQDIWQQTRANFGLNLKQQQPRIENHIKNFQRHPKTLERFSLRAKPYYAYILQEVLKRDMPAEIALLPMVESAYDPFAYSHVRASGLWQFIPSTAKHFRLKESWWYDGRRDLIDSTDAALTYLQQLYARFNDWELALAAYNAGGGNVSLAMKKNRRQNKAIDFWSLKLPKETQGYVPKLLALAKLIQNPEKYGITLIKLPSTIYFHKVQLNSQIDLAQAAHLAEIDITELYQLNPGFNRWATDPKGPHRLLLPATKAQKFIDKLVTLPAKDRIKWLRYRIKSGDSLGRIAQKHRTTITVIKQANKLKNNKIIQGQILFIPIASKASSAYVLSQAEQLRKKQSSNKKHKIKYRIKNGDSFWLIAKRYKVSIKQLAAWNYMKSNSPLIAGKTLVIWQEKSQAQRNKVLRKVYYTTRNGDSLARIAQRFKVRISDIRRWNKLDKNKVLQPKQRLVLEVNVTQ